MVYKNLNHFFLPNRWQQQFRLIPFMGKKKFNRAYLTALFLASKDNKDLSLHSFMENTSLSLPSSPRPSLWVANDCTLAFAKAVTKTETEPTRDTFLQSIFN